MSKANESNSKYLDIRNLRRIRIRIALFGRNYSNIRIFELFVSTLPKSFYFRSFHLGDALSVHLTDIFRLRIKDDRIKDAEILLETLCHVRMTVDVEIQMIDAAQSFV